MVYEFEGSTHGGVDPQAAGELISRVARKKGGAALSKDVVDAARPKTSAIHMAFQWDDQEAAEMYRRHQATQLVRDLVVVEERPTGDVRRPAFYHVSYVKQEDGETRVQGYQPVEQVIDDPDARDSAAEYLLSQLEGLQRRFDNLGDLFQPVWLEVARIRERLDKAA